MPVNGNFIATPVANHFSNIQIGVYEQDRNVVGY